MKALDRKLLRDLRTLWSQALTIALVTAAVLFAARSLGHPVLLYDGSFQEWSGTARLPVVGPPAK